MSFIETLTPERNSLDLSSQELIIILSHYYQNTLASTFNVILITHLIGHCHFDCNALHRSSLEPFLLDELQ